VGVCLGPWCSCRKVSRVRADRSHVRVSGSRCQLNRLRLRGSSPAKLSSAPEEYTLRYSSSSCVARCRGASASDLKDTKHEPAPSCRQRRCGRLASTWLAVGTVTLPCSTRSVRSCKGLPAVCAAAAAPARALTTISVWASSSQLRTSASSCWLFRSSQVVKHLSAAACPTWYRRRMRLHPADVVRQVRHTGAARQEPGVCGEDARQKMCC
jgi:hypothetical protein